MGRTQTGILGPIIGKVGTVVGVQTAYGFYLRSLPKRKSRRGALEIEGNNLFGATQSYLSPISAFLKVGFNKYYTKTGGSRGALAYNRKHAMAGVSPHYYLDPASFRVSGGELPGAENAEFVLESEGVIRFNWETNLVTGASEDDQVMLLAYDMAEKNASFVINGALRKSGTDVLHLDYSLWDKELAVYIGFVSADRSVQSNSQYLGMLVPVS